MNQILIRLLESYNCSSFTVIIYGLKYNNPHFKNSQLTKSYKKITILYKLSIYQFKISTEKTISITL